MTYEDIQRSHKPFEALRIPSQKTEGPLQGVDVSVKDNIVYKELPTTAGSNILRGYTSSYTADIVRFLKEAGARIIGKTKMDAFGFGTYGQHTAEPPIHPEQANLVPGGSSSGSAVLTALAPTNHVSIAVSTGGSISCPAALCSVVGYTPSIGHVSRHGLIPYADSFDAIGAMAKTVERIKQIEPIITQPTKKDMQHHVKHKEHDVKTIGVPRQLHKLDIQRDIKKRFQEYLDSLKETYKVKQVDLPKTYTYSVPAYYTVATSEASTNLARYDGLRYGDQPHPTGNYHSFASKHRGRRFSAEEKRRVLLGTYIRTIGYEDQLYERAQTAIQHIQREHEQAFREVDAITTPTMPFAQKTIQETKQEKPAETYAADILTIPPKLAGTPHITLPNIPGGVHITTPKHTDRALLDFAETL